MLCPCLYLGSYPIGITLGHHQQEDQELFVPTDTGKRARVFSLEGISDRVSNLESEGGIQSSKLHPIICLTPSIYGSLYLYCICW